VEKLFSIKNVELVKIMADYEFEKFIDRDYLVETLLKLLKVDCSVPLGPDTLMKPDDPKLVHYVQKVIRPELQKIGVYNIIDLPRNQIAVKFGKGTVDKTLLIMAYTPVQHFNWMKDPFSAKIAVPEKQGVSEACAFGQGASQNKSHFTSMLTLLKSFIDSGLEIDGTLYFVANNEGRSSHECSWSLIPRLEPKPDYGLILIGGGNRISVANRGRVDVLVQIHGEVTHSSTPENGLNAIEGAVEVLNRIKNIEFNKKHPKLGGQHAIPYQLVFEPVAPHTLPSYARIKIDRRLLPGDDVDEAVEEIRNVVGDMSPFKVTVEKDVYMLPSETNPGSEIVKKLQKAIKSLDGEEAELVYGRGAYDAGGPTSMGVPTIMWGRPVNGTSLMGDDFVSLRGVEEETRILGRLIVDFLS
jgi:acetylornithine deacetylase/succinyl-diaminopimelate desuccinylase-like protein